MRRPLLTPIAAVTLLTASVFAQPIGMDIDTARQKQNKKLDPPTLAMKNDDGQTLAMIAAFGFIIVALAANLIPPKRGHQD
jgi:hypothetical protein